MLSIFRKSWQVFSRQSEPEPVETLPKSEPLPVQTLEIDFEEGDPLLAYLERAPGVVEVDKLQLESAGLQALKQAGVKIAVPLVSQGELIGLLNLGSRLSEQDYSSEDRRLLSSLAAQAAPALRVAQLARQQQAEARQRERMEQELRVARVIQQTLLPKSLPSLAGWRLAADWRPARAVSGDFYDFIPFPDGRLGIVEGDVTDKGVPAALVMATTRSLLRSISERHSTPGEILAMANDKLCPDIPPNMFITCLFAVLDPARGEMVFANAGHNLPILQHDGQVSQLLARGMPLGLLPGMEYEEKSVRLEMGDRVLIYSDGLIEAHNPVQEMFGIPYLLDLLTAPSNQTSQMDSPQMINMLLQSLQQFTGPDWEQEDDVTFVIVEKSVQSAPPTVLTSDLQDERQADPSDWKSLALFHLPSRPGNERQAMEKVTQSLLDFELPKAQLERLKTAVSEATMNAMEHGNHYREDLSVDIEVLLRPEAVKVLITDHGGQQDFPLAETPNLEAKLEGLQSPRGWGLFLIKNMVDDMQVTTDKDHHTMALILKRQGENHE
jgi:serine phosphatase RsbU (regulator of sigma subunit)/anti-sigma regulatory factor (Ser/Thr protein kinase)